MTLDVLAAIKTYPHLMRDFFVAPEQIDMSPDTFSSLFTIQWSETGSNSRAKEEMAVAYWLDLLEDIRGIFDINFAMY